MFNGREAAALAVAVVGVDAGADDQLALVRLADVAVHGVRHDHGIEDRLQRLGDVGLQRVTFDRQPQVGQRRDDARVARHDDADLLRPDRAARRLDARDRIAVTIDSRYFALLDDVDAEPVGRARKTPGDGIVPGNAGARLQRRAEDRVARVG